MAKNFFSGLFGRKDDAKDSVKPDAETAPEPQADTPPAQSQTAPVDAAAQDLTTEKPIDAAPEPGPASQNGDGETAPPPASPQPAAPPPAAPQTAAPQPDAPAASSGKGDGWLSRLAGGLSKSSSRISDGVAGIFTKKKLDSETLEELEELLITADLGLPAAERICDTLSQDRFDKEISDREVRVALAGEITETLTPLERPLTISAAHKPHVILMIGVNGAGKTTTIGKLAQKFRDDGKSVMLAAGDTFRAAAIEQLTAWGERTNAPVLSCDVGGDAAGLAFDAVKQAQRDNVDILMIDTAGRLQNKTALMDELAKIVRVLKKLDDAAPHDVVLVLDATVGQNAISQAQAFSEIAGVTGLIMTKLDGTARGGVLVALADKFKLPIHYIGVGESVDDLQPFRADAYARALVGAQDDQ